MRLFRLYGTEACHLCEIAEGMIAAELGSHDDITCEQVDIAGSDALFERYGLRIPVLQHPDRRELDWPFTAAELRGFLAS